MADLPPAEIALVLRSISTGTPDPRFAQVKEILESDWRAIAFKRFPKLGDDFKDAIQDTWSVVLRPEKLDAVRDDDLIRRWARQVFLNKAYDFSRWRWSAEQDELQEERLGTDEILATYGLRAAPTPEEEASGRERLVAILDLIGDNVVARLRTLEGLSDRDIAHRLGLQGRDAVAGQLKRFRARLRTLIDSLDRGKGR